MLDHRNCHSPTNKQKHLVLTNIRICRHRFCCKAKHHSIADGRKLQNQLEVQEFGGNYLILICSKKLVVKDGNSTISQLM